MELETIRWDNKNILKLRGDWTIERAGELKPALLEALANSEQIVIDMGELSGLDLSTIQLLCSAHRKSIRCGKQLGLGERKPEALKRMVREAGLVRTVGCHKDPCKSCLWTGDWTS
ncbi:MAG: STAS domain-containing protein [Syntrophobacteraceae bacterium]